MKIITWNCNGAFRKKYFKLDQYDADILVIQECENPEESTHKYKLWAENYLWYGENKNRGIGIFAKKHINLQKLNWINNDLKLFLPCRINNEFNLLAVWTKNAKDFQYIGQFWNYLQLNKEIINNDDILICGDFNSNTIWDKKNRKWNHSNVVKELAEINIYSLYHKHYNEIQGKENTPTLYMQRKLHKPYHVDYAFASENISNNNKISIGKPENWLEYSDHMPMVINIQ